MSPSAPDPFEAAVIENVARDTGIERDRLVTLLDQLQDAIRPGRTADDLVYEYRKAFASDPLIERQPGAYYLAVPDHVWSEFGDALDCSPAELRALRTVHERQFRAALGETDDPRDPVIVVRDDGTSS